MSLAGCISLPGATSTLSLTESVSALATTCAAHIASGQVTNASKLAVRVDLKIAWLSVTNATLATAILAGLRVPAHGQTGFKVHPSRPATNALSCTATVTSVRAA
jgi:hypothetical protein